MRGIRIQLTNGFELDLAETEVIATTYAVNNLRDIESRQAHYTNTFRLPLTQANADALDLPQHINTFSRLPYQKVAVRVLEDDIVVLDAVLQMVRVIDGWLECEMTGGNYNFFELIEGVKLSQVDLSSLTHTWTIENILATETNTWENGYIYPVVDYGRGLGERKTVDDFYPAVFVKYLIQKIATANGFRVKGRSWTMQLLENMLILPFEFPGLDDEFTKARSFRVGYTGTQTYEYFSRLGNDSELVVDVILNQENDSVLDFFDGSENNYNPSNGEGTINGTGIYNCSTTFHTYTLGPVFFAAILIVNDVIVQDKAVNKYSAFGRFETLTFEFDPFYAQQGDVIKLRYKIAKRGTLNVASGNIYLDDKTVWSLTMNSFVVPGADISLTSILGDLEAKELFLLIANQFNLLFITDTRNKILYIEPFDAVLKNIPNAVDLSSRIDLSEPPEVSFILDGYGKNTVLQYDDATYPGTIKLDNQHLEDTVVGYDSPFSLQGLPILEVVENTRLSVWDTGETYTQTPIQDYVYHQGNYYRAKVNAPTSQNPDANGSQWEQVTYLAYLELTNLASVAPPLAVLDRSISEPVTIYDGTEQEEYSAPITIDPIKFDVLVDQNYRYLGAALNNNKFIRVLLRLDSIDIATLDFTKPIRLQSDHLRYGETITGYFFILAIDQYQHGVNDSTWVDLMRIEPASLTSYTQPTDNTGYLLNPSDGYVLQPTGGRIIVP